MGDEPPDTIPTAEPSRGCSGYTGPRSPLRPYCLEIYVRRANNGGKGCPGSASTSPHALSAWPVVVLAVTAKPSQELHPSLLWLSLTHFPVPTIPSAAVSHRSPSPFNLALHLHCPIGSLLPFQAASTTWAPGS